MNWEYEYNRLVNSTLQLNEMYKRKTKENEEYKEKIDRAKRYIKINEYYERKSKDYAKNLLEILGEGEDKE